jgi:hypothetical protein
MQTEMLTRLKIGYWDDSFCGLQGRNRLFRCGSRFMEQREDAVYQTEHNRGFWNVPSGCHKRII